MNHFRILTVCVCLSMCSIGNINATNNLQNIEMSTIKTKIKNSDVPIDFNACEELYNKLYNNYNNCLNQSIELSKYYKYNFAQLKKMSKLHRPHKNEIAQMLELLCTNMQNAICILQDLSHHFFYWYTNAYDLYIIAKKLNDKKDVYETEITNRYEMFMEFYETLKYNPEYKQIWDKLLPFINYLKKNYSTIIEEENNTALKK